jgi:tellurite resistance protein
VRDDERTLLILLIWIAMVAVRAAAAIDRVERRGRQVEKFRAKRIEREYASIAAASARLRTAQPDDVKRLAADLIRQVSPLRGLAPPYGAGKPFSWGCAEQRGAVVSGISSVPSRKGGEMVRVSGPVWSDVTPRCSAIVVRAVIERPGADPAESRVELWPMHKPMGGTWQLGPAVEAADHSGFTDAPIPGAGVFDFEGAPCVHEVRDAAVAAFLRVVRAFRLRAVTPLDGLASPALLRSLGDAWMRPGSAPKPGPVNCRVGNVEVVGAELRGEVASIVVEVSWMGTWDTGVSRPPAERSYLILERSVAAAGRWTLAHFSWEGDEVVAARIERALLGARTSPSPPSAVLAWAVAVAAADGRISRREREGILAMASAAGVAAEDAMQLMMAAVQAVRARGDDSKVKVPAARPEDGAAWLRSAIVIAIHGGLTKPELAVLTRLGASIGMSAKSVRRLVDDVIGEELKVGNVRPAAASHA